MTDTHSVEDVCEALHELNDNYYELIMAVETKFPNETRHETALRYIQEAERKCDCDNETSVDPKDCLVGFGDGPHFGGFRG